MAVLYLHTHRYMCTHLLNLHTHTWLYVCVCVVCVLACSLHLCAYTSRIFGQVSGETAALDDTVAC